MAQPSRKRSASQLSSHDDTDDHRDKRSRESLQIAADAAINVSVELHEVGHGADVTITTPDGCFCAHKSTLGERSPFFRRAFVRSPVAGRVCFVVAHNALIMHAILRHIYRLPLDYITIGTGQNYDVAHTSLVSLVILRDAAMMFGLPELITEAEQKFNHMVGSLNSPALLADLGAQVFGTTDSLPMRSAIVAASAAHMQEILADDNAWFNLYSNEAFSRAVLKLAYPIGHESSPLEDDVNQ